MSMINDNAIETLGRLEAMNAQEEDAPACYYFLPDSDVDEECRASMIKWFQQIAAGLSLGAETVWTAANLLDRYLSSGRGRSPEALVDRYQFQLAAIAALYTAAKVCEKDKDKLNITTLVAISRGYYPEADVLALEEDLLFALDWRTAAPTPVDFVRHFLELLADKIDAPAAKGVLKASRKLLERTTADLYFAFCKPSVVGAACLTSCLLENDHLPLSDRQAFWLQLARTVDLMAVMEAEKKLLKLMKEGPRKPRAEKKKKSRSSRKSKKSAEHKPSGEKSSEEPAKESRQEQAVLRETSETSLLTSTSLTTSITGVDEISYEVEDKLKVTEAPAAVASGDSSPALVAVSARVA